MMVVYHVSIIYIKVVPTCSLGLTARRNPRRWRVRGSTSGSVLFLGLIRWIDATYALHALARDLPFSVQVHKVQSTVGNYLFSERNIECRDIQ